MLGQTHSCLMRVRKHVVLSLPADFRDHGVLRSGNGRQWDTGAAETLETEEDSRRKRVHDDIFKLRIHQFWSPPYRWTSHMEAEKSPLLCTPGWEEFLHPAAHGALRDTVLGGSGVNMIEAVLLGLSSDLKSANWLPHSRWGWTGWFVWSVSIS